MTTPTHEKTQPTSRMCCDNRATQHYAVADYGTLPRRVQRITLAGDVPVSVDGTRSRLLSGDDTAYNTALAQPGDGQKG
jgi:taurine dioxygenase